MKLQAKAIMAALAIAFVVQTSPSQACDFVHVLEQKMTSGEARVSMNGAYVDNLKSGGITSLPLMTWLISGKNTVTIDYISDAEAAFELKRGCKGGFPEDPALETKVLKTSGRVEFSFDQVSVTEETYMSADTLEADKDGSLIKAVMNFRNAVEQRDSDTVIKYAAPMLKEIERLGYPVQRFEGMIRAAVEKGEITVHDGVWAQEVVTGNILQFVSEDFEPMITSHLKIEGGSMVVPLGTFWGRFDGKWGVVMN